MACSSLLWLDAAGAITAIPIAASAISAGTPRMNFSASPLLGPPGWERIEATVPRPPYASPGGGSSLGPFHRIESGEIQASCPSTLRSLLDPRVVSHSDTTLMGEPPERPPTQNPQCGFHGSDLRQHRLERDRVADQGARRNRGPRARRVARRTVFEREGSGASPTASQPRDSAAYRKGSSRFNAEGGRYTGMTQEFSRWRP